MGREQGRLISSLCVSSVDPRVLHSIQTDNRLLSSDPWFPSAYGWICRCERVCVGGVIGGSRDGAGQIKQGNVGWGMPRWREYSQRWIPTGSDSCFLFSSLSTNLWPSHPSYRSQPAEREDTGRLGRKRKRRMKGGQRNALLPWPLGRSGLGHFLQHLWEVRASLNPTTDSMSVGTAF